MLVRILSVLALIFGLAACAGGEEFESAGPDEMKSGPGLFSGEDGEFTLKL